MDTFQIVPEKRRQKQNNSYNETCTNCQGSSICYNARACGLFSHISKGDHESMRG